jgi:hypothetical protein
MNDEDPECDIIILRKEGVYGGILRGRFMYVGLVFCELYTEEEP